MLTSFMIMLLQRFFYAYVRCISTEGQLYATTGIITDHVVNNVLEKRPETMALLIEYQPGWKHYNVTIRSYGSFDKGFGRFRTAVTVNGATYLNPKIGFRVVQYYQGELKSFKAFDTHHSIEEGNRMAAHLLSIKHGTLVMVAIEDEASYKGFSEDVQEALRSIGAKDTNLEYRGSYCLITLKGQRKSKQIKEVITGSGKGPSVCNADFLIRLSRFSID